MVLDSIFLSIYVLEAILKLIALGLEYFYDPWNNLGGWVRLRQDGEGALNCVWGAKGRKGMGWVVLECLWVWAEGLPGPP